MNLSITTIMCFWLRYWVQTKFNYMKMCFSTFSSHQHSVICQPLKLHALKQGLNVPFCVPCLTYGVLLSKQIHNAFIYILKRWRDLETWGTQISESVHGDIVVDVCLKRFFDQFSDNETQCNFLTYLWSRVQRLSLT